MTDIKTSLEKLEKVDPETWHTIYEMGFNTCSWPDDLIQGCIQRAIAAYHGETVDDVWYWQIEEIQTDYYEARIYNRAVMLLSRRADTPAAAILAAYVAAREAQI